MKTTSAHISIKFQLTIKILAKEQSEATWK